MLIKWFGPIKPSQINAVAVSGGIDSMVLLDFLLNVNSKPDILFFHHDTPTSEEALNFLLNFASEKDLNLIVGRISNQNKPKKMSQEEWWREERYNFLSSYYPKEARYIAMAHHLNDAVETWLFNCFHGNPRNIPYSRGNIVRPLLVTSKEEIKQWANNKNVEYHEDQSNFDVKYARNRIRHNIYPEVLKVNPGIEKVVKKNVVKSIKYF